MVDAVFDFLKRAGDTADDLFGSVIVDQDARGVILNFSVVAVMMVVVLSGPFNWFGSSTENEEETEKKGKKSTSTKMSTTKTD